MSHPGKGASTAFWYGLIWLPTQLAQWFGQCKFILSLLLRRNPDLIEYKAKAAASPERETP
jgi:hypothetical protein